MGTSHLGLHRVVIRLPWIRSKSLCNSVKILKSSIACHQAEPSRIWPQEMLSSKNCKIQNLSVTKSLPTSPKVKTSSKMHHKRLQKKQSSLQRWKPHLILHCKMMLVRLLKLQKKIFLKVSSNNWWTLLQKHKLTAHPKSKWISKFKARRPHPISRTKTLSATTARWTLQTLLDLNLCLPSSRKERNKILRHCLSLRPRQILLIKPSNLAIKNHYLRSKLKQVYGQTLRRSSRMVHQDPPPLRC